MRFVTLIIAAALFPLGAVAREPSPEFSTTVSSESVVRMVIPPDTDAFETVKQRESNALLRYFAQNPRFSFSAEKAGRSIGMLFDGHSPIFVAYRSASPLTLGGTHSQAKTWPGTPDLPYPLPSSPNVGDKTNYMTCGLTSGGLSRTEWTYEYRYTTDSDGDGDNDSDPEWVMTKFTSELVTSCPLQPE